MSTLATTNIKHASSSSNNIVLTSDGKANIPGHIIQVVQNVKTDQSSTTSSTFSDTGLSQAITPTSSSSKILFTCSVTYGGEDNAYVGFKVLRDSTEIGLPTTATGNQSNICFGGAGDPDWLEYMVHGLTWTWLDSPSTTNSTTYKVQYAALNSNKIIYINRPQNVENNSHVFYTTSTLTLMEVAA